jgi:hypothetical protein
LALFWLQDWSRAINGSHIIRKIEETLTSLYQTKAVIYFEPQLIALTASSIVMKSEGINPTVCDWDNNLIKKIAENEERIKEVKDMYLARTRYKYT